MHVLRHSRMAAVGTWGGGGHSADQIRVRFVKFKGSKRLSPRTSPINPVFFQLRKWHSNLRHCQCEPRITQLDSCSTSMDHPWQVYSNGISEVILGKAIKQLNLPREEIVVMTKVKYIDTHISAHQAMLFHSFTLLYPATLGRVFGAPMIMTAVATSTSMVRAGSTSSTRSSSA